MDLQTSRLQVSAGDMHGVEHHVQGWRVDDWLRPECPAVCRGTCTSHS